MVFRGKACGLIRVEYHADLTEVQGDPRLAWALGEACQSAPFDRLAWWRNLADNAQLQPLLAVARDGEAIAALALAGTGRELGTLANWYTFRFRPVSTPGADRPALLGAIARDLRTRARRITLTQIPDECGSASMLQSVFRDAGWQVWLEKCDRNHVLDVADRSYATFLQGRPGPLRTTLDRKAGKIAVEIKQTFTAGSWSRYEEVYRQSWKPREGSPGFLRQFAEEEGRAGRLRLGLATAGERTVAAQLWTVEGNTAFIHKLAHTEEAKSLSPGTLLSAALFEHVIDRDQVSLVDFGTGDDPYKRDWMDQVRPRYRLDMLRPEVPANWPIMTRHAARRLAGRVRPV